MEGDKPFLKGLYFSFDRDVGLSVDSIEHFHLHVARPPLTRGGYLLSVVTENGALRCGFS